MYGNFTALDASHRLLRRAGGNTSGRNNPNSVRPARYFLLLVHWMRTTMYKVSVRAAPPGGGGLTTRKLPVAQSNPPGIQLVEKQKENGPNPHSKNARPDLRI